MEKPKFLELTYEVHVEVNLDGYDIDWNNVKQYHIKYSTLAITFNNGDCVEYDIDIDGGEVDFKYPTDKTLFNKDYKEVKLE